MQLVRQLNEWAALLRVRAHARFELAIAVTLLNGRSSLSTSSRIKGFTHAQLVRRANEWAALLRVGARARFEMGNATVSLAGLLATYPGPLQLVTILARGPALAPGRPALLLCQASELPPSYSNWSRHTCHAVAAAPASTLDSVLMVCACTSTC